MKSVKAVKTLEEIVLPFTVVFPVTVEGIVNRDTFLFRKGERAVLTFPQYEMLRHSQYEQYLN